MMLFRIKPRDLHTGWWQCICWSAGSFRKMSPFDVIHHVGRALETECPAAVRQSLIANTDRALGLRAEKNTVKDE